MITLCGKNFEQKHLKETFTFRADAPTAQDEVAYALSRKFLKELNLKGDSVGWCELLNPSYEQLCEIFTKAYAEKMHIWGNYELVFTPDFESEWYEITGTNVLAEFERDFYLEEAELYLLCKVKAFTMPSNVTIADRTFCDFACFREDVVKALIENGFDSAEYLWIPDIGHFKAKQYYNVFPKHLIPYCYENIYSTIEFNINAEDFKSLGESVYTIAKNCSILDVSLPTAVEKSLLPDCDFAGIYSKLTQHHRLLVRKRCRDFLIKNNLAKPEFFEPIIVVENITQEKAKPLMYMESGRFTPIPQNIKDEIEQLYKKHCEKVKPKRVATEKTALQSLRNAKRENDEFFGKRASEKFLSDALDERLIPYYKVANGGVLSDEYTFLSIEEAKNKTADFWVIQNLENNDIIPEGSIIFGTAADGEVIILMPDGKVVRYQQGEISFSYEWNNIQSFFTEEIN